MTSSPFSEAFGSYLAALDAAREQTHRAEERHIYTKHLAEAALIWLAFSSGNHAHLSELIRSESRSFGWGYLQGDLGRQAEEGFHKLAALALEPDSATQKS